MFVKTKRWIGLLIAGVILLLFACLPEGAGLTRPMLTAAGLLLASLWVWISEVLPMSVSILGMIGVAILGGLLSLEEAFCRLDVKTALFILCSAAIATAVGLSNIPQRITRWMLKRSRGHSGVFIMGFGMVVTLCSAIMSSLATCAMFAGIVNSMLGVRRSNLKRCLMIIIPACAGIGGFITPAGTPANLLLLSLLESQDIPLSFVQWCLIGFPAGLLTAFLFLLSVLVWFHPSLDDLQPLLSEPMAASPHRDQLTMVVVAFVLLGWVISSWIPGLQLWHVACLGMIIMLLPGVSLLQLRDLPRQIHWDLVITMGTIGILMGTVTDSGLAAWCSERLLAPLIPLPLPLLLPCLSCFICFIRTLIPTTTGTVSLLAPVLLSVCMLTGLDPSVVFMVLGFWTASAMLVVWTEPIYLLTWSRRDYSPGDLFKAGIIPTLFMSFLGVWLIRALAMLVIGS